MYCINKSLSNELRFSFYFPWAMSHCSVFLFCIVFMWTKSAPWSFTTTLVWLSISCKRVSKIYSGFGTGFSRMSEGASNYSLHLRAIFWQTNIYIQISCEWGSLKPIQYLISDSKKINEINFDDAVMPNETKFLS